MERRANTMLMKPLLYGLITGISIFASLNIVYNLRLLNAYEIYQNARFLLVEIPIESFPLPIWFFWPLPLIFCIEAFVVSYFDFKLSEALVFSTVSFLIGVLGYYIYETIRFRQLISSTWWHAFFLQSVVITSVLWLIFLLVGSITGSYTRLMMHPKAKNT